MIEGVARYAREHEPWQLLLQPRGERERSLMPRHWRPDGVIARITHHALAADLRKRRVPVVNVSLSTVPGFRIPQLTIDERILGAWAAAHLRERGYRHFGYFGLWKQANYVDRCGPAFVKKLAEFDAACTVHFPRQAGAARHTALTTAHLQRWLQRLPKPIGIFIADAEDAHELADACRAGGLHVPEDVAILVGEDDRLLCEISHPPLSAIDLGSERIGYQAAAMLHRWMSLRSAGKKARFVPPLRIITRHSTNVLAIEDRALANAIRYVRNHAVQPVTVTDMLRELPFSRRVLEMQFRQVLGVTPATEIRRIRLEHAKELLATTDMSMPEIAA
ncbi:MAG: substrate-binding domain-containing protein, partial [Pirellulales bacterium]